MVGSQQLNEPLILKRRTVEMNTSTTFQNGQRWFLALMAAACIAASALSIPWLMENASMASNDVPAIAEGPQPGLSDS